MTTTIPVVVVVGPTAAGKTDLAISIAAAFDGEVVSADAFQVYRGLDIGTAKVGDEITAKVPHHCIDIADPDEHFNAGRYAREAAAAIAGIHQRGRLPIVAGGSGLYIRALIDGLAPLPRKDERFQTAFEAIEQRRGTGFLYRMMEALDGEWARAIGAADRQRMFRGLEVSLREGRPMSQLLRERGWTGSVYAPRWVAVTLQRPLLFARLARRLDDMLQRGWLDEVGALRRAGFGRDAPALRAIGYRELGACLDGELDPQEARELIYRNTRRYAKRQLTWFRGQTPARWYELADEKEATKAALFERVNEHLRDGLTC